MNPEVGGAWRSALFGPDFPPSSTPYFVLWPRVSSLFVITFYLICLSLLNLSTLLPYYPACSIHPIYPYLFHLLSVSSLEPL
jgi:hypothetical protein